MKQIIRHGIGFVVVTFWLAGCASNPPGAPVTPAEHQPPQSAPVKAGREKTSQFRMTGQGLELPGPVVFRTASAELGPESDDALFVVVDFLDARPDVTL